MTNLKHAMANPLVVLREEFDDWAILFNPETADAVGINPAGVAIWKLLDGRHSFEDIVSKLKDYFSDVPDTAMQDVTDYVKSLSERGFVGYELNNGG